MSEEMNNSKLAEWQEIEARASVLMKRGMSLASEGRSESLREALRCFDSAYELRRQLPVEEFPNFGYALAACLLNRGETLMQLTDEAGHVSEAIAAYDRAIELLRKLSLQDNPKFPRRLAIACQNRGLALQALVQPSVPEATAAFSEAVAILEHPQSAEVLDRTYLLATAYLNLANLSGSVADPVHEQRAQLAALRAIELVSDLEAEDANVAEVGLKARHVFCRTVAPLLSRAPRQVALELVHQSTDVVDEGLELIRGWEKRGDVRFRAIAEDLFKFGVLLYEKFQPQFLGEFIVENFDADRSSAEYVALPEMRRAGEEVLARAERNGRRVLV